MGPEQEQSRQLSTRGTVAKPHLSPRHTALVPVTALTQHGGRAASAAAAGSSSIRGRQLSRAEGGRRRQPMRKSSVEPPVWALAHVDQWERAVWEGAGDACQWEDTARGWPAGSAARRARLSPAVAAAAAEEEVEDVGHARAGGGAGSERAAWRPGAAAGRLRRCGGVMEPPRSRGWNGRGRWRPVPAGSAPGGADVGPGKHGPDEQLDLDRAENLA